MIRKTPPPTPEAPEFTDFTVEQKKLLALLLNVSLFDLSQPNPSASRYYPDQLIESGLMGPENHLMNTLIDWGLVTTGETTYDDSPDTGYALTDEGADIARHLDLEKSVPDYTLAGWQAALRDEMNKLIAGTRERRIADAKAIEDRQRFLGDFKRILERIGVKDATPANESIKYQNTILFVLTRTAYKRNGYNEPDYNLINFDLTVQRVFNAEEKALWEEMDHANNYGSKYGHRNFTAEHGFFSQQMREYPIQINLTTGDLYHHANLSLDLWPRLAKEFAQFVLNMEANWQQLKIEWEEYGRAYDAWKAEQERVAQERHALEMLQREAEETATEEAAEADVYTEYEARDTAASALRASRYEPFAGTIEKLEAMLKSIREGGNISPAGWLVLSHAHFVVAGRVVHENLTRPDYSDDGSDF